MDNHYHLLIQTPDGNLGKGMRQLNDVYTQASDRRIFLPTARRLFWGTLHDGGKNCSGRQVMHLC